jgi:hypothetical protein
MTGGEPSPLRMRGVKPRLGRLSSETTAGSRFMRQMAEPRLHAAQHRQGRQR